MFNKINWNKKHYSIIILCFIIISFALLFYKFIGNWSSTKNFLNNIMNLLSPFLIAFLFAFLINPGVTWFENLFKKYIFKKADESSKKIKYLSILVMYLIVIGVIIVGLIYIIPQLATSISNIKISPEKIGETINPILLKLRLDTIIDIDAILSKIELPSVINFIGQSIPQLIAASKSVTTVFFNIVLGVVISIYMINDKDKFINQGKNFIYAITNKDSASKIISVMSESNTIFKRFFIGKALDSLIIGIMCFILMSIFRFDNALLISFIVGITNMIPYFGPFIGAIPGFIIIFIFSPVKAFWFLVLILALQQFDGIVLGPKILGDSVGLRPFWIIFSIIIGGGLFGFVGMLLGVPVFTVIYNLCNRFIDRQLELKNISPNDIK